MLGGHQAPKQPAGPFAAVVVDGFVEVVPGTSGFGGDSDAVQGQVNEQLTPASRDSFAALSSDGFVLSFAALRSDGFFFGVVKVFCGLKLSSFWSKGSTDGRA